MKKTVGLRLTEIKTFFRENTFGAIALAAFFIAVVSGIFLAIPYDVKAAYQSLGAMLILNPYAVFIRNIHYWSAQFFLVFTFLHIWDHLKRSGEKKVKYGVWLRLTVSVLVVLFVMITGFILKADNDATQARQIMQSLISQIPLAGNLLAFSLFGNGNGLQLIYVHHIATATIFLFIIIIEHSGTIYGKTKTFIYTLLTILAISWLFGAPLGENLNNIMRGPWYFVGLQEILHWLPLPGLSLVIMFLFLLMLGVLPYVSGNYSKILKKTILFGFYLYLGFTVVGWFFRGENQQWRTPWDGGGDYLPEAFSFRPVLFGERIEELPAQGVPVVNGRAEGCMICHDDMKGFSPSHDPQALGCVSCHGGNSFTIDKNRAHKNMRLIPGNLTDAGKSCGTAACHPEVTRRINTTLMTTISGMITVDRFVFGECDSLSALNNVHHLTNSAADEHLKNLCVICHLGNPKTATGPVDELSRGGGCNACHLNYSDKALAAHAGYSKFKGDSMPGPGVHPALTLNIPDSRCFGCHSRSGRISTNYEGWHETQKTAEEVAGKPGYRLLQDDRVFVHVADDVHHQAGLNCIDCHSGYETMGDGNFYRHEEQQVQIRCEDCHFDELPQTVSGNAVDGESGKILKLRHWDTLSGRMLTVGKSGLPLVNTFVVDDDSVVLIGKNTGKVFQLEPPSEKCTRGGPHKDVSCSACHTAWAPRCIGCHNVYEPETQGYDMLTNRFKKGTWVEYTGEYAALPPALGVFDDGKQKSVQPAIPGMILTIDLKSYPEGGDEEPLLFHRLYAPAAPHTIMKKGRSCKSCHNDPLALGYGEGVLQLAGHGKPAWTFVSKYADNPNDGLPEDAWAPFGFAENKTFYNNVFSHSTRPDFRPFTIEEQKRILTVGACLTCHDENSTIMRRSLKEDFKTLLKNVDNQCVLPVFE